MNETVQEQLLRESRERYESLVHCLPDGVVVYSDHQILFANEAALKLLGASDRMEVEGRPLLDFVHEDYLDMVTSDKIRKFIEYGKASQPTYRKIIRLDGQLITAEVRSIPIVYDGKRSVQLIIRDMSPWIRVEETLTEKDVLYKSLMENVVAGVFVEQNDEIVYANPYLLSMFGYRQEELRGMKLTDFVYEKDLYVQEHPKRSTSLTDRKQFLFKIKGKRKDGGLLQLEGNFTPIVFNGGEALLGTIQEVTQKREKEQILLQNAKLYQRMLRYIPEPLFITYEGELLYVNRYALELIGAPDETHLIGRNIYEYIHEDDRDRVRNALNRTYAMDEPAFFREARVVLAEDRILEVEGSNIRIDHYMGKSVVLSIIRDLTERKRSEERMLRSEKLSVIGQLAAGVAHEIRNPLTALKGFTQLLRAKYKDDSAYFDIMAGELDRINLIVNEFMTLAKPHWTPFRHLEFGGILQSVLSVLETQATLLNVEIECRIQEGLPAVYCNENQLKQVLLNIIKNAIEAMPDGGRVTIQVREAAYIAGPQLQISIQDEGPGMPEEIIRRLGEPFVTTKEKGTGLGLMVSTRIIETHQGTLHIRRGEVRGTIVEITLPLPNDDRAVQADDACGIARESAPCAP
ncbi:PAS domain-containing sensor histidine kinase [Paenibacillus soyae]|uniref:histidine kinase n=1 Tax=Paenibacillus soyae TaxID=2969249 RepID=A0A9X2S6R1_9BACL|nr:PAS domain-containing sensor histidine kinase [Paenibacillus soyae]MCR2802401.1 PAS domain S-box protein [Paenibacillus soyae]